VLVYGGVDIIACLGLSLEYGTSGVVNFGFIIYQAAGAYTAAVLSLPPDAANGGFQQYLGGLHLPFPLPWVGGALVGGLIAIPTGAVLRRKLQSDYAAIFMFVTAVILNTAVTNYRPLFNGAAGLALVPAPLSGKLNPEGAGYQWLYSIATIALCVAVYLFLRKVTESPYGRSLRAMRENDLAAASIGKDIARMRMTVLVLGGGGRGPERRRAGGVHQPVGPVSVDLPRDDRAVRRPHCRRERQSPRGGAGRRARAARLLGDHAVHPSDRAARLHSRHAVGGDRAAHPDVPLVPAAGRPPRAAPPARSTPGPGSR